MMLADPTAARADTTKQSQLTMDMSARFHGGGLCTLLYIAIG